jgi:hypothetical protein
LKSGNKFSTASSDQLFTFLKDERWYNIVMMQSGYFDLYPLNSISADKTDLSIPALLPLWLSQLKSNQPLDL